MSIAIGDYSSKPRRAKMSGTLTNLPVAADVENLRNFAEFLNYEFLTCEGKLSWTKGEVMRFLEKDVRPKLFDEYDNARFDGLIVAVSSHGAGNNVISSDYKLINRTDIHRCISDKYPQIREIPRIFLFDACDGTRDRIMTPKAIQMDTKKCGDSAKNAEDEMDGHTGSAGTVVNELQLDMAGIQGTKCTEWSSKHKNPDYNLVVVHGANEGFVSKMKESTVGSYLTYFFTKSVRMNIEQNQRKGLGEMLKDIQNLLHDKGKQLIRKEFFNETENLRIEINQDVV